MDVPLLYLQVNSAIEEKQGADICGRAVYLDVEGQKPKPQTPGRQSGDRQSFDGKSTNFKMNNKCIIISMNI